MTDPNIYCNCGHNHVAHHDKKPGSVFKSTGKWCPYCEQVCQAPVSKTIKGKK